MLQILAACWELLAGLLASAWGVVSLLLGWLYAVLYHLHVDAPRLEGLLVGIALAWLLSRREKHPVIKVLSSPLKLVLDILDLLWDQVVEVVADVKGVALGWIGGSVSWVRQRLSSLWGGAMSGLRRVRDGLLKRKSD